MYDFEPIWPGWIITYSHKSLASRVFPHIIQPSELSILVLCGCQWPRTHISGSHCAWQGLAMRVIQLTHRHTSLFCFDDWGVIECPHSLEMKNYCKPPLHFQIVRVHGWLTGVFAHCLRWNIIYHTKCYWKKSSKCKGGWWVCHRCCILIMSCFCYDHLLDLVMESILGWCFFILKITAYQS